MSPLFPLQNVLRKTVRVPSFSLKNELRKVVSASSTPFKKIIAKMVAVSPLTPFERKKIIAKNDHCVPDFALKESYREKWSLCFSFRWPFNSAESGFGVLVTSLSSWSRLPARNGLDRSPQLERTSQTRTIFFYGHFFRLFPFLRLLHCCCSARLFVSGFLEKKMKWKSSADIPRRPTRLFLWQ